MKLKHLLRWRLSTLLVSLLLVVGIVWWFAVGVDMYRDYQDYLAFQRTNKYELEQAKIAAGGDIPGLVTILGESRFKHWAEINQIKVLDDGRYLSSSDDGSVRIWNHDGSINKVFEAFSIAVGHGGKFYAISREGALDVYQSENDKLVHQWKQDVDYSRIKFALSESGRYVGYGSERRIGIYDLIEEKMVRSISNDTFMDTSYIEWIYPDIAISPNAEQMAVEHISRIFVVDIKSGNRKKIAHESFEGFISSGIEFNRSGTELLFGNGDQLGVYDSAAKTLRVVNFRGAPGFSEFEGFVVSEDTGIPYCLNRNSIFTVGPKNGIIKVNDTFGIAQHPRSTMSIDRETILFTDDSNKIRRINLQTGAVDHDETHWNVECIEFAPDKKHLIAGCSDGVIRFFNVVSWKLDRKIDTLSATVDNIAVSLDGKYFAAMCYKDKSIYVFDTESGKLMNSVDISAFFNIKFTRNNDLVMSDVFSRLIQFVDIETLKKTRVFDLARAFTDGNTLRLPRSNNVAGIHCHVTADGRWLLTCDNYHSVSVWDVSNEKLIGSFGESEEKPDAWKPSNYRFFVAPDERSIATIGSDGSVNVYAMPEDLTLISKNAQKIEHVSLNEQLVKEGHVAFSHDGKLIFTVDESGKIKIWDRKNGSLLKTIRVGFQGSCINDIKVSKDDRYFASRNGNGTVYVFRTPSYSVLRAK